MNWTLCTEVKPGWCDRQHMMEEQTKLLEERETLKSELRECLKELEIAGQACGMAATFLDFHGTGNLQLKNCVKLMEYHEERAEEAFAEIKKKIKE